MRTDKVIPEYTRTETVQHFVVRPASKEIVVFYIDSDGKRRTESYDISPLWTTMTTTQKNIVKGFFKAIAAAVLSVETTDITGNVVED